MYECDSGKHEGLSVLVHGRGSGRSVVEIVVV